MARDVAVVRMMGVSLECVPTPCGAPSRLLPGLPRRRPAQWGGTKGPNRLQVRRGGDERFHAERAVVELAMDRTLAAARRDARHAHRDADAAHLPDHVP